MVGKRMMLLLLAGAPVFANGGPVNWSALLKTGNIVFENYADYRIEKEHIHFELDGDYANVSVEYQVTRDKDTPESVLYAFPVDVDSSGDESIAEIAAGEIPFYEIRDNGEPLSYAIAEKGEPVSYDYPDAYDYSMMDAVQGHRIFFTSLLSFKGRETKTIRVRYRVRNRFTDLIFSSQFTPVFTERLLVYSLKPAENWGKGVVDDFSYTIDFSGLTALGGEVLSLPGGGVLSGRTFSFHKTNFDLNRADDIIVVYEGKKALLSRFYRERRIPDESIISIKTSSTLSPGSTWSYEGENLIDGDYETVWVEAAPGNGVGESIEIELTDVNVGYIGLINGFCHSREFYRNNGRALKVKYRIECDRNGPFFFLDEDVIEGEADLSDLGYGPIDDDNLSTYLQRVFESADGGVAAKKITLTIVDALEGDKYRDLCLGEVVILGYTYEELRP